MQIDRQSIFFFIILIIFLIIPNGNDESRFLKKEELIEKFKDQLKIAYKEHLNSRYETGYGNIIGFKLSYLDNLKGLKENQWPIHVFNNQNYWEEREEFSILPDIVSNEVKKFWGTDPIKNHSESAYLLNIAGKAYGEFSIMNLERLLGKFRWSESSFIKKDPKFVKENDSNVDKLDKIFEGLFTNETSLEKNRLNKSNEFSLSGGKISLSILNYNYNFFKTNQLTHNISLDDAILIHIRVDIKDYEEIKNFEFDSQGIYFQKTGSLITTTNSDIFFGIYGISHMTLNKENFMKLKLLMDQHLKLLDFDKIINLDYINNFVLRKKIECELILYLQLERTKFLIDQLNSIDKELLNPTGTTLPKNLPKIDVKNFLIYLPNCGKIFYKKPNSTFKGHKTNALTFHLKKLLRITFLLVFIQLFFFLRQVKKLNTPGKLSKISSKTLFLIAFQDFLIALFFLLMSTLSENLYFFLISIAMSLFVLSGIFELKLLIKIIFIQMNEGNSYWTFLKEKILRFFGSQYQENNALNNNSNNNQNHLYFLNLFFFFGFALSLLSTFLILNSLVWRLKYRIIFEYFSLILSNSFWIPQFFRNTIKNKKKSFTWEYIIVMSIIRMIPISYLCLYKQNLLSHHYDPYLFFLILFWFSFQICLLYLQILFGPRFWTDKNWIPKSYDYYRILDFDNLEKGHLSDILKKSKLEKDVDGVIKCKSTCSICISEINFIIYSNKKKSSKIKNDSYMITPCNHIFHSDCLENWLSYKLQCPVCRDDLPPV